jgi:hypothetical protein
MNLNSVKPGLSVKTSFNLGSTRGMLIAQKHLDARKPNAEGVIKGWVPGHGGDVWWVEHKDGSVGAYSFDEFNPA